MHIKDIILDGFKCYENPTVLKNLDKSYNAITGLNGSGKSNVIDAIVFTLNLESKKLLRANTLKDLINTHRKDCKVTLVLSNKDKSKSPPGYKDYNEIIISRSLDSQGKSKFSINNHICTSTTISKFCSSIGIHSEKNSPFIVMQGHITKVLNMKSKEIGTLIEETAGTRSYTKEKEKALQVLEKKEIKLKGVRDSMERRISPFYERLSQERVAFIEQKTAEEKKIKSQKEIKKFKDLLKKSEISKGILNLKEMISEYKKDFLELKEIEKKIINLEKEDYAHENLKLKNELEEEEDKLRRVEIDCREEGEDVYKEEDGSKVDGKDEKDDNYLDENNLNSTHYNNIPLALLKEKEKIILENLRSNGNLFGDSNKIKNKEELTILENKKLEEEIKLKEKRKCNKGVGGYNLDKDYKEVYNQDHNQDDHNNYEIWLDKKINFLNNLKINEEDLKLKINKLDFLKSKINYPFIKGVYGSVGENIKIKDKKYLEAINTILGNKIKHIIVENEVIGGDLLKKADRRISVIPLNKIIIKKNLEIKGLVRALDLVDFDLNLKKAIEYVLGNIFVFENKEEARRSCFEFGILCVTLEGIIYDPKGTVTGGKSIGKIEIVTKKEIEDLENEISKMKKNKNEFEKNSKNYEKFLKEKNEILEKKKIKENIKILNLKIETLKKMIKNDFNKKDLENLRKEIIKKTIEEKKDIKIKEREKERRLERERQRESRLESIKERDQILIKIKEIKEKINENQKKNVNKKEDEDLENKQKNLIREVLRKKNKIKKIYEVKIGDLEGGVDEVGGGEDKVEVEDKDEMEEYEDTTPLPLIPSNDNSNPLSPSLPPNDNSNPLSPSLPPNDNSNLLDLDFINPKIFNFKILNLSQDQENQIYQSLQKSRDTLKSLNSRKSSIRMDPSNFNLLEKYDHDISTLKEKINKIEKDKEKILKSITNFDSLGIKEMEKAFKHINKKLGVLLRYFLPDSDAKIVKNGESGGEDVGDDDGSKDKGSKGSKDFSSKDNGDKDIITTTNYELKVKIGNWKDSLLELSGGQRSLVALCLIFSMLTYKPAPFYIFDEIDAALDLNYTQSIGEIIKKEFDSAQFIVISLKNGMYDNANSVFKVFIKNGKSAIAQIK